MGTTGAQHVQTETVPLCVYCNSKMMPVLKDRLTETGYTHFECKDCGWEVRVPLAA